MPCKPFLFAIALSLCITQTLPSVEPGAGPDRREIRGGTPATVYDYPFVTLLVGLSTPVRVCTGVLLSDQWVLTAAHCADGLAVGENSWDSELLVTHGYPTVTETRHAVRAVMHEDYDPLEPYQDWEDDIALLRMNEAYLSRTAVTVDIVTAEEAIFLQPGTMATAVGWGGEDAESMTSAEWPLTTCPENSTIHLCTQRGASTALENGDSGGPLLVRHEDRWVLVGVHSSTDADGVHRHVRVAEHLGWMADTMASEEPAIGPCADPPGETQGPPPLPVHDPNNVIVPLGTSGESVVLTSTESGGWTRDGAPFVSGMEVEAGNGNAYRLTLSGGMWTAEYTPPRPRAVGLGRSGDAILITRREDGRYQAGDAIFSSGGIVVASNGSRYRMTLSGETWKAAWVPPAPVTVSLGTSGETVLVKHLESGGYAVGERRVVDGSTVYTSDGTAYRLTLQNGTWKAELVEP